jgi:hypothetical protein
LPRLITISTSIAMTRYLNSTATRPGAGSISCHQIGSRIFAPRSLHDAAHARLDRLLVSLGRWQLRRADEKRALYDAFAAGSDATRTIDRARPALPRYQHVEADGHYDQARQMLIDNMSQRRARAIS